MNEQVWNLKIRHEIQRKRKYWNMNCSTNQAQRIYHVAFAPFQFLAPIAILAYSFARILKVMRPNLQNRYQMRSALHLILWKYSQMMLLTLMVKDPKRNLLSWKIIRIENGYLVLRNHLLFSLTNAQRARKFKNSPGKKTCEIKYIKKINVKLHFWQFQTFSQFKN